MSKYHDAAMLRGKTITAISMIGTDRIEISTDDGKRYAMFHDQDCCESVKIVGVVGNIQSLVGFPLVVAREETSSEIPKEANADACNGYIVERGDSFTFTFYFFETEKSKVIIRWLGVSNGYYSESVQIEEIT